MQCKLFVHTLFGNLFVRGRCLQPKLQIQVLRFDMETFLANYKGPTAVNKRGSLFLPKIPKHGVGL